MTITFAVNDKNDLYVNSSGNMALAEDLSAVLQNCAQSAKAQLGEMVLVINRGIPNFQTIWEDAGTIAQFQAALRTTLMQVQNVIEVPTLDVSIVDNVLVYEATIVAVFGQGVING